MDKRIIEVLEKFAAFVGFDPDRTSFKMSFKSRLDDYTMHNRMKRIVKLQNYDATGSVQLMYAHYMCKEFLKEQKISLYDYITNKEELAEFDAIWAVFQQPFVQDVQTSFMNNLNEIAKKLVMGKVLGEFQPLEEDRVLDIISNTLSDIEKLQVDAYSIGPKTSNLSISSTILMFPTLKDALQTMTMAPNGIYVAYIGNNGDMAGWFAFFIKDGDNLVSYNERYDFSYPRQQDHMRNGRSVANSKADGIFPYDYIFEYGKHDYRGYATDVQLMEDKLAFFNLGYEVYLPMLVSMLLLKGHYLNNDLTDNQVYSMPLMLAYEKETPNTALITIDPNHALAKVYDALPLRKFELAKVKSGEYASEFANNKRHYKANMRSENINQNFVDIYANDITEEELNQLASNPLALIESCDITGSKERVELFAYWSQRDGLANYISAKMHQDFQQTGGLNGLKEWFSQFLNNHKDEVIKKVLMFDRTQTYIKRSSHGYSKNESCRDNPSIVAVTKTDYNFSEYGAFNVEAPKTRWDKRVCPITGTPLTIMFSCELNSFTAFQTLFGTLLNEDEAPHILKTWEQYKTFHGNNILDMIDPVDMVVHPVNKSQHDSRSPFKFTLAFSKQGYAQYCKEHDIPVDKFWIKAKSDKDSEE